MLGVPFQRRRRCFQNALVVTNMSLIDDYKNRTYINYTPSFIFAVLHEVTDEPFVWNEWLNINHKLGILQCYGNLLEGPKTPIIDRTGLLAPPIKSKLMDPIPEIGSFNRNFNELMLERAKNLIDRGLPIDVHYSGGIDSAAVLVALLQASKNWDQFTIILDDHSVNEYPLFFEKFIKGKLNYILENELSPIKYRPKTHLGVNGQGSAPIFGSIARNLFDKRHKPWTYVLENKLVYKSQSLNEQLIETINEHIVQAPFEINTPLIL